MSYTFVSFQQNQHTSGNNAISLPLAVTVGQLVVAFIISGSSNFVSTVTDNLGNTWNSVPSSQVINGSLFGETAAESYWSIITNAGTSTITAHWTSGFSYAGIQQMLYDVPSDLTFDAGGHSEANLGALSVELTTSSDNDLIIAFIWTSDSDADITPAPGYTDRVGDGSGVDEDSFTNTAGLQTITNPSSGTSPFLMIGVSFMASSTPPGPAGPVVVSIMN
jgi:hypothetical protein